MTHAEIHNTLSDRVTRLEEGLEQLTKSVNELVVTVKENNDSVNARLETLQHLIELL